MTSTSTTEEWTVGRAPDLRPAHIVVVGDDDDVTSAIAGALARRLHRPLLDRTAPSEAGFVASHGPTRDACGFVHTLFDEATRAGGVSVIAAPSSILDRPAEETDTTDTWTVGLDDPTTEPDAATSRNASAARTANAEQLCDVRIDTSDGVIDRIVEQIDAEWRRLARKRPATEHGDRR